MKNQLENETEENGLIVYSKGAMDLSKHVTQLKAPIDKLNPESRMIVAGGMYAGGFLDLQLEPKYVMGIAYMSYFHEKNAGSLLERMANAIFGEEPNGAVENARKNYAQQWRVSVGSSYYPARLLMVDHLGNIVPTEFLAELKTNLVKQQNILLSNEFLGTLFAPIFSPLIQIYEEIARF